LNIVSSVAGEIHSSWLNSSVTLKLMKKSCEICAGSGQISYFKGVSRFLLSWEECTVCNGTGYQPEDGPNGDKKEKSAGHRTTSKKGKKRGGRK
jgi:DnaJ-class molecular chaperone